MSTMTFALSTTTTTIFTTETQSDDSFSHSLVRIYIYGLITVSIVSVLMACTLCIFLSQYTYDYIKRKRNDPASNISLFTAGLIYFIVSIIELLLFAFNATIAIRVVIRLPTGISATLSAVEFILYLSQYFILLLISLLRLRFVFTDSVHSVNPHVLQTFFCILLLLLLSVIPVIYIIVVGHGNLNFQSLSIFAAYIACLIVYSIAITALYLFKLYQCHRESATRSRRVSQLTQHYEAQEDPMLQIVRRNAILVTVSVTMTVAQLILLLFAVRTQKIIWNLLFQISWMTDIYTNAVSVMLSYSRFDTHYRAVCGCMDRAVRYCMNGSAQSQKAQLQQSLPSRSRDSQLRKRTLSVNVSQTRKYDDGQRSQPSPLPAAAAGMKKNMDKISVMSSTPDTTPLTPVNEARFGDLKMQDLKLANGSDETAL